MEAVREAAAGDELFNTYGEKSNASLLQMHGFTLPANPHDFVCISGGAVRRAVEACGAAVPAARLRTAEAAGLISEPSLVRSRVMMRDDACGAADVKPLRRPCTGGAAAENRARQRLCQIFLPIRPSPVRRPRPLRRTTRPSSCPRTHASPGRASC